MITICIGSISGLTTRFPEDQEMLTTWRRWWVLSGVSIRCYILHQGPNTNCYHHISTGGPHLRLGRHVRKLFESFHLFHSTNTYNHQSSNGNHGCSDDCMYLCCEKDESFQTIYGHVCQDEDEDLPLKYDDNNLYWALDEVYNSELTRRKAPTISATWSTSPDLQETTWLGRKWIQ